MDLTREILGAEHSTSGPIGRGEERDWEPAQAWPGAVKAGTVGYPIIIIPC